MTFDLWAWYDQALVSADRYGVPRSELDWLVQAVLGIDRLHLRLRDVTIIDSKGIEQLWQKRLRERVPVQYLAGKVWWRGMELVVNPAVLIPRPETEVIIDLVDSLPPSPLRLGTWVDMGTGSGAIAIALAKIMPNADIHATDISPEALAVARLNAQQQGVNIHFHRGHWYEPIIHLAGRISGIVSNPPYIPRPEIRRLDAEVRHEPVIALDGGADGYDAIAEIFSAGTRLLHPGGYIIVEMMPEQAIVVKGALSRQAKYTNVQIHRDLHLMERFVSANLL